MKNAIGIVAEYNPFHNGHALHLAGARRLIGENAPAVAVMSGSFMQRGEPAFADKWLRAACAVNCGVDVVFELPTVFSCRSAEFFAAGAVQLLAATGVIKYLAFGAETADAETLTQAATYINAHQNELREIIKSGSSYAAAQTQLLAGAGIKFDANQSSSVENCEFSYDEDRLSFKVEPLQRTQNFLEDVDFSKSSYSENSYYYLSDETLCNDFYPSLFYETTNYHELPAQKSSENFDEMEIDAENLARLKESEVNSLVLSGWACADSAFVANEHEDYGDIEFPNYIKNRKFELRAEITFKSGEEEAVASYKKSFDWMNTGWQLCSLYLPLEFEKEAEGTEPRVIHFAKNDIETIKFYFDYSHNTGNALYTELVLKEAKWQSSVYDKEARTVV